MSNGDFTQANRFLRVFFADVPDDTMLLRGFSGREAVSELFRFELDLVSPFPDVDPLSIVGKEVTVSLNARGAEPRLFQGYVSRFAHVGSEERFWIYRAEMVPKLWFLTQQTKCRIYQNQTTIQIVEDMLESHGFARTDDWANLLSDAPNNKYEAWEYCVQYRETDFNFVSRLMEHEGIFYFFRLDRRPHVMVLGQAPDAFTTPGAPDPVRVARSGGAGAFDEPNVLYSWTTEDRFIPGKYATTDYNFEQPSADMAVNLESPVGAEGSGRYRVFDAPGDFATLAVGTQMLDRHVLAEAGRFRVKSGTGNCRGFCAGYAFELEGHARDAENGKYVLTSVRHAARDGTNLGDPQGDAAYHNSFTALKDPPYYRPRRVTPKPVVQGVQTAVVVGKEGEEIYTDKYGRVKVQFHWDWYGGGDENSSCWVRVAQTWAGKHWGSIQIPRIGQEVVVDFLEGDPDCPIIIGSVYNAEQMPPWDLPANRTQSGLKSRSSKGGGSADYNELRFEDKKGAEQVYLHAERNWDTCVEANRSLSVGADESITVGRDRAKSVGKNETVTVTASRTETVGVNETVTIGVNQSMTIGANRVHTIGANDVLTVGGAKVENVGAVWLHKCVADVWKIQGLRKTTIGGADRLTVGGQLKVLAGSISMTGSGGVVISGPGGSITIDAAGVTITGTIVKINS